MNAAPRKRRKPATRQQPKRPSQTESKPRRQPNRGAAAKSTRTPKYLGFVVLAFGAIVLAAIVSRGSDEAADPNVASASVEFVGTDFAFAPGALAGLSGQLEVTLVNNGPGVHNLAVLKEGVEISTFAEHTDDMNLAFIPLISPDNDASTSFDIDAGTYQVVCVIPGHLAAGMKAELVVEDAPSAGADE